MHMMLNTEGHHCQYIQTDIVENHGNNLKKELRFKFVGKKNVTTYVHKLFNGVKLRPCNCMLKTTRKTTV